MTAADEHGSPGVDAAGAGRAAESAASAVAWARDWQDAAATPARDGGDGAATTESLADRAATILTDEIVAGTLRPGQWVSENELAIRLGVSRSPVREALRALARDGLVSVRPRRGTVIAELSAEDVSELYAARGVVESEMVRLAAVTLDDAAVDELAAIVAAAKSSDPDPAPTTT